MTRDKTFLIYNYSCVINFRKINRVSGVSLYIENKIDFTNKFGLEYFYGEMESLFGQANRSSLNMCSNVMLVVIE